MGKAATQRLIQAIGHAETIGTPLNRFTTINWTAAEVRDPRKAQRMILKYAYDWMYHSGGHLAYVWVMEHGSRLGLHTHFLFHLSPEHMRGWNRRMAGWLKKAGLKRTRGVSKTLPIGRGYGEAFADGHRREAYKLNLRILTSYILKGADATGRRMVGIIHAPSYSALRGRRYGTSRNLYPSAIRAFHAHPKPVACDAG